MSEEELQRWKAEMFDLVCADFPEDYDDAPPDRVAHYRRCVLEQRRKAKAYTALIAAGLIVDDGGQP